MARAAGLAHSTIYRIWRAFSLQQHRSETFKLSSDPLSVDKVRDIVGPYLDSLTSASWINQIERFFAPLTDQQIKRGAHRSTKALQAAITTYIETRHVDPKPFRWIKAVDDILAAIQRFCHRTLAVQAQCG
jgi:hypothetical protein